MSSMNVIKDTSGTYIPSSQRPDGTWRKPIKVKDGYVPQEEQPLYISKGKQYKEYREQVPVGMTESDVSAYRGGSSSQSARSGSALYDVGMFTLPKVAAPIPGLNFVKNSEPEKPPSKSAKKKSKSKNKSGGGNENVVNGSAAQNVNQSSQNKPQSGGANASAGGAADPAKRLRNLRKRLKDIETLEKKISSGELKNPEKDQLEKIQRKEEVVDEIEDLEKLVDSMNLS